MTAVIGTSGWQYADWKDVLYPGVPLKRWLEHYATAFPAVEINNTFYNLPKEKTFADWAARTPPDFIFVCKASRYITHIRRLEDVGDSIALLMEKARPLGDKLGAVLYQLPPTLKRDDDRLNRFLERLPAEPPAAIEFRHPSWEDEAVYGLLRSKDVAFCVADGWRYSSPHVTTAQWAYIRFHGPEGEGSYDDATLERWADRTAAIEANPIYVFFNNDKEGNAVGDARRLAAMLDARGVPVRQLNAGRGMRLF